MIICIISKLWNVNTKNSIAVIASVPLSFLYDTSSNIKLINNKTPEHISIIFTRLF